MTACPACVRVTPLAVRSSSVSPTVSSSSEILRLAAERARLHSLAPLVMLPDWAMAQNNFRVTKSTLEGFIWGFMGVF